MSAATDATAVTTVAGVLGTISPGWALVAGLAALEHFLTSEVTDICRRR
jgi:hypothetical protein